MSLRFALVILACSIVAACGARVGGGASQVLPTQHVAGPAAQTAAPTLYVADSANNAVDEFVSTDSGDTAPFGAISGPDTGLGSPNGVAEDHSGVLYVANDAGSGSVTVYPAGSFGDAIPTRTITCGGLSQPGGITLDGAGNLYVANTGAKSISVFSPTDSGCVSGNRMIVGIHTCLFAPRDVDARANGTLYVASQGSVLVYRPGASGDAAPMQKISGSNTRLMTFGQGVSLDRGLNIYVTSSAPLAHGRVTVYAPSATGNVAPIREISGNMTTLDQVNKIEVDPTGQAFVTNGAAMDVFAPGAGGNVAPSSILTGPSTTLQSPMGLDIGI